MLHMYNIYIIAVCICSHMQLQQLNEEKYVGVHRDTMQAYLTLQIEMIETMVRILQLKNQTT